MILPIVTQETIEAFIAECPDQVLEVVEEQPELAHFLKLGMEQFIETWGEAAAASAASFACMVYALLKRQAAHDPHSESNAD